MGVGNRLPAKPLGERSIDCLLLIAFMGERFPGQRFVAPVWSKKLMKLPSNELPSLTKPTPQREQWNSP